MVFAVCTPERCPSGRRSTLGKRVWGQLHRGFESRPLRHPSPQVDREPTMEPGPCASSPFEPCQARKGAALRRISTSAAGRLGSMVGFSRSHPPPTPHDDQRTKTEGPRPTRGHEVPSPNRSPLPGTATGTASAISSVRDQRRQTGVTTGVQVSRGSLPLLADPAIRNGALVQSALLAPPGRGELSTLDFQLSWTARPPIAPTPLREGGWQLSTFDF